MPFVFMKVNVTCATSMHVTFNNKITFSLAIFMSFAYTHILAWYKCGTFGKVNVTCATFMNFAPNNQSAGKELEAHFKENLNL